MCAVAEGAHDCGRNMDYGDERVEMDGCLPQEKWIGWAPTPQWLQKPLQVLPIASHLFFDDTPTNPTKRR